MKRLFFVFVIAIFVFAACNNNGSDQNANDKDSVTNGKITTVLLKDIENIGDSLIEKTVKITGYVDHVCHEDGKKMVLVDTVENVRFKIITENPFDTTLEGTTVSVIGILKAKKFTIEDYRNLKKKMLEHHPDGLDEADKRQLEFLLQKVQNSDSAFNMYFMQFEKFAE